MSEIKTRTFKESNYHSVYYNGKTLRIAIDAKKPITELEYPEFYDVKITNKCLGACPNCFVENTLFNTVKGNVPIQDVKIGDIAPTYNEYSKQIENNVVSQVHKTLYEGKMIELEFYNGIKDVVTPDHPYFTKNRGWIEAKDLNENDEFLNLQTFKLH